MEDFQKTNDRLNQVFDKDIVFIVGATRWGTDWVQQFLDRHPDICCKGEGHFTDKLFPVLGQAFDEYNAECETIGNRMQNAGLAGNAAGFTFEDVHHIMTTAIGLMLDRWTGGEEVKVIAEKTPEHIVSLDLLARAVPGLKIVHVFRDGRDEALAAWRFNNKISQGAFRQKFPAFKDFAATFAANWVASITAARRFDRDNKGRCFHFRAEDLQGEAVAVLSPLLGFLGVEASDGQIKDAAAATWEAAPLDIDPGGWRQEFDDGLKADYQRDCGELLKLLDYGK